MFSSPLLSPPRDELSLPATSKALLTSLLISIISTYRRHIRRPFDGTICRASLEYVLVPTAVSTTRRALSLPATSKALLTSLLISIIRLRVARLRGAHAGPNGLPMDTNIYIYIYILLLLLLLLLIIEHTTEGAEYYLVWGGGVEWGMNERGGGGGGGG